MIDDFENKEVLTSGELWSQICSSLPEVQAEATPENNTEFKDSFQPSAQVGVQVNGQSNGTNTSSPSAKWEPMEDSEIYIASLGIDLLPCFCLSPSWFDISFSSPCFPSTIILSIIYPSVFSLSLRWMRYRSDCRKCEKGLQLMIIYIIDSSAHYYVYYICRYIWYNWHVVFSYITDQWYIFLNFDSLTE